MWTILFIITTVYFGVKLFTGKINLLAILWYFAERGVELPDKEDLHPYYEKVVRKMMKID